MLPGRVARRHQRTLKLRSFSLEPGEALTQLGDLTVFCLEGAIYLFRPSVHPSAPASSSLPQSGMPVQPRRLRIEPGVDLSEAVIHALFQMRQAVFHLTNLSLQAFFQVQ